MKLVLATNNRDKVAEIKSFLAGLSLEIVGAYELAGIPDVVEDAATLRENALKKAREVAEVAGTWTLADDTGLFVTALRGAPGVYSARYAGPKASYLENVQKLLREMQPIKIGNRSAEFICVMALVHPDGREVVVESRLIGEITLAPQGKSGFGYDPVFLLPKQKKTLAELTLEEKNRISHRGQSLYKMKSVLETLERVAQLEGVW